MCVFSPLQVPFISVAYAQEIIEPIWDEEHIQENAEAEARKRGVDPYWIANTLWGEARFRHDGIYGDHGSAYGAGQFHESTFDWMLREAIKQGEPFQDFTYKDLRSQIILMVWAFQNGLDSHWTCSDFDACATLPNSKH